MNDFPAEKFVEPKHWGLRRRIADVGGWKFIAGASLLWFFAFCEFFPWLTRLPMDDFDASWILALHWAHLHHLDFGHEIVYTFGPWGFTQHGYLQQTFDLVVASCALLSLTFSASVLFLGLRAGIGKWTTLVWSTFFVALVATWLSPDTAPMILSIFLLMASLGLEDGGPRWMEILLAITLAFFSLCKFPMFALAVGIIAIACTNTILRRKIPWAGIVYVVTLIVFWLAAGQSPASFFPFVQHSLEISSGYAQGEGVATKSEATDLLEFLACVVILIGSLGWAVFSKRIDQSRPIRRGTLFIWGLLWLLFLTFKDGYIRHDAHAYGAAVLLCATAFSGIIVFWKRAKNWPKRAALVGSLIACLALAWTADFQFLDESLPRSIWRSFSDFPHQADLALGWLYGSSDSEAEHRTEIRMLTALHQPIVDTKSTVDVYPGNIRAVLGAGMNYDPRPVIQSLLAYTPALAELNADFLRSLRAPELILFDIDPLENHLASEEDSLSWPEILTRYDLLDPMGRFVILKRSANPRRYSLTQLAGTSATWGQSISVPASNDPIWITIQLNPTIRGKIVQAILRPPPLSLDLTLSDQQQKEFRLIPAIAQSGFLLSPAILERNSFAALFSPDWQQTLSGISVENLRLISAGGSDPTWAYGNQYFVRYYALNILP